MNTGFYGVVGSVCSAAAYGGNDGNGKGNGSGKGPNGNGSNNGNKPSPLEIAQAIVKWYEKNAEKLANSQNTWVLNEKMKAMQEELDEQGYDGLAAMVELKTDTNNWKRLRQKEFIAAKAMRALIRMDPGLASTVFGVVREIEREHEFQSLVGIVYEAAQVRGYAFWHTCKTVQPRGRKLTKTETFTKRNFMEKPPCYRVCERYSRREGKWLKEIPVTLIHYVIRETGETMKTEKKYGHSRVEFYSDPVVYSEIERGFETVPVTKEHELKILRKFGQYCPILARMASSPMIMPTPDISDDVTAAPDHFPSDIIGDLDGQTLIDIRHSGKHGEETA